MNLTGRKHILYVAVFIVAITFKNYGQVNKFNIGIEAGPSRVFVLSHSNYLDLLPLTGFLGGIFCQLNFNEAFSLRTGVGYEGKGWAQNISLTDEKGKEITRVKIKMHLDYITVPVLFRVKFGKNRMLFANGGPYVGYLLRKYASFDKTGASINYWKWNAGVSVGLGVSIPVKKSSAFSIEIRNNQGIFSWKRDAQNYTTTANINATYLLLGYTFR